MQYALETTYFTGQEAAIKNHGDRIWNALCDNFHTNEIIRTNFCLARPSFMKQSGLNAYAPITARNYIHAILANVAKQEGSSLEKVGKGIYIWVDP